MQIFLDIFWQKSDGNGKVKRTLTSHPEAKPNNGVGNHRGMNEAIKSGCSFTDQNDRMAPNYKLRAMGNMGMEGLSNMNESESAWNNKYGYNKIGEK
jgi:hypothetical protein